MAGLIYQQRPLPNNAAAVRIISTHINWEAVESDPAVIAENSQRITGRIKLAKEPEEFSDEPCAVVAFAPSLRDNWREIEGYKTVFTCSGSHRYLLERGLVPTFHVDSDPRAYKADILGAPHRDVTYLISSICHPTYFDKLELHRARVKLWHMLFTEPEIWVHFPKYEWIMTGGHTVGPRAVKLAHMMGYRNIHIYGMDGCSDANGNTHAEPHPNPPTDLEWITYNGKRYKTNRNWEDHGAILLADFDRMPDMKYTFHGEGLIQEMAKLHVPVKRAAMPARVYKDAEGRCAW